MRDPPIKPILALLIIIFLAITVFALFSLASKIISIYSSLNLSGVSVPQISIPNTSGIDTGNITLPEKPPAHQMPDEMQRYFEMKNLSCATLKGNFLIVTEDTSRGAFYGLSPDTPDEMAAAESLMAQYDFNQTTKTYVRGDWVKRVVISEAGQTTTIWKEGRVYNCTPDCTMRLFTAQDSADYASMFNSMKTGCAYFGRTALPSSVDMERLIQVERVQPRDVNGFRCQDFMITGNKTYARTLLSSGGLSEEQGALLWGIAHLDTPVEECLDEATGIIVLRNFAMDLSETYRFNYSPDGYMNVYQQTKLTYFTDNVPESFLALPG